MNKTFDSKECLLSFLQEFQKVCRMIYTRCAPEKSDRSEIYVLQAKNKQGDLVTLAMLPRKQIKMLRNKERFFCPECGEAVIVRAGTKIIPHFAHRSNVNCTNYARGEGVYHEQGKLLLYKWLLSQHISTELEPYLPDIRQRPDLFIRINQRKIAIEYQCARMPLEVIRKRNEGYQKANITPIWILGANQFKRIANYQLQVNSFTLQFLHQFSVDMPTCLYYFCPQQQTFCLVRDLVISKPNRAIATFHFTRISQMSFLDLFTENSLSNKKLYTLWKKEKKRFRLTRSRAYGKELLWRNWLYEKKVPIDQLPSLVHLPIRSQHLFSVSPWNWQSRFLLDFFHPLPIGSSFSLSQIEQFLHRHIYHKNTFPLLKNNPSPIKEYIAYFIQLRIIDQIKPNQYVKRQDVRFYSHIEEALKGDDELLKTFMYNQYQEQE